MVSRRGVTATCVDSSALLRWCLGEGDVTSVAAALAGAIVTSVLTTVEAPCAIHARFHRGLLSAEVRDRLLVVVRQALHPMTTIGLTAEVRREAIAIGERFLIRSLDAIHLASAVVVARQQRRRGNVVRFCTADLRQAEVAAALLSAGRVDVVPPLPQHAP
ncbi:MAG: type II toxin-antitoxin system VapC family toxin [Chloroflexota bacterium]